MTSLLLLLPLLLRLLPRNHLSSPAGTTHLRA
jgi:hypothetical protein